MSYRVTWAQNKNVTLGRVGKITLEQARQETARYLADAHEQGKPLAVPQGRKGATSPTLRAFIHDTYLSWFEARSGTSAPRVRLLLSTLGQRFRRRGRLVAHQGTGRCHPDPGAGRRRVRRYATSSHRDRHDRSGVTWWKYRKSRGSGGVSLTDDEI